MNELIETFFIFGNVKYDKLGCGVYFYGKDTVSGCIRLCRFQTTIVPYVRYEYHMVWYRTLRVVSLLCVIICFLMKEDD